MMFRISQTAPKSSSFLAQELAQNEEQRGDSSVVRKPKNKFSLHQSLASSALSKSILPLSGKEDFNAEEPPFSLHSIYRQQEPHRNQLLMVDSSIEILNRTVMGHFENNGSSSPVSPLTHFSASPDEDSAVAYSIHTLEKEYDRDTWRMYLRIHAAREKSDVLPTVRQVSNNSMDGSDIIPDDQEDDDENDMLVDQQQNMYNDDVDDPIFDIDME